MSSKEKELDNEFTDQKNQTTAQNESDTPFITPGYDYIWGSDQDDLVEGEEK